ncbi:MAG: UxaA family hydrolase [Candidatus Helarchaeota archaeon]
MHSEDNVATVLERIDKDTPVELELRKKSLGKITAINKIKFLHKIAIKDIPAGKPVIKYGQIIGRATVDIRKGDYVHTRNVKSWFYA